jgi:hypothetical protein
MSTSHERSDFGRLQLVAQGTIPTDGTEQIVIESIGAAPAETWGVLDLVNMQGGDTLQVKEYIYSNGAWGLHSDSAGTITGVAALPKMQIGPTIGMGYRLTIKRTAGVDRNYPYEIYKGVR